MLSYKLIGSGLNTLNVESMKDVATGLTATGSTRTDAYEVTFAKNAFSSVPDGTGAILDSDAAPGDSQLVYNGGANVLRVYPTTGATINNLAANSPALVPTATACEFFMMSTTAWVGVLSK